MLSIFALLMIFLLICITVSAGASDASGAITGCMLTRSMTPSLSVKAASVCMLIGGSAGALSGMRVAMTFYGIADLGENTSRSLIALCCALLSTLIWSLFAHSLCIPTSESHALLSSLTGAALANTHSIRAIKGDEWRILLFGFALSTVPSFLIGFIFNAILRTLLLRSDRRRATGHFRRSQKWSALWSACVCGAQDTQKFAGIYMLGLSFCAKSTQMNGKPTFFIILLCSFSLSVGALLSSRRAVKRVGTRLCELDAHEYGAAGAASSMTTTVCTILGLPADLLQARACAFLGAGLLRKRSSNARAVLQILGAWLLTFPVCISLSFLLCSLAYTIPVL